LANKFCLVRCVLKPNVWLDLLHYKDTCCNQTQAALTPYRLLQHSRHSLVAARQCWCTGTGTQRRLLEVKCWETCEGNKWQTSPPLASTAHIRLRRNHRIYPLKYCTPKYITNVPTRPPTPPPKKTLILKLVTIILRRHGWCGVHQKSKSIALLSISHFIGKHRPNGCTENPQPLFMQAYSNPLMDCYTRPEVTTMGIIIIIIIIIRDQEGWGTRGVEKST
jgi:hypothetical protein